MDIMNIMKVSSSKFTLLSVIALAAVIVGGSGAFIQTVDAANTQITFTAIHENATQTKITFSEAVNGTKILADWGIDLDGTRTAGDITYDVAIYDIHNGTVPSAGDIASSSAPSGITGLGYLNNTTTLYLKHTAIPTDSTYYINYTNNPASANDAGKLVEKNGRAGPTNIDLVTIGFNATGVDYMSPTALSAHTTSDRSFNVVMSEPVIVVNATADAFDIVGSDEVPGVVSGANGTSVLKFTMQNPIDFRSTFTLSLDTSTSGVGKHHWIADSINSEQFGTAQQNEGGVGNQLLNFTGLTITNYVNSVNNDNCYDCDAPKLTELTVDVDGETYFVYNDNPLHINAVKGDTITYNITFDDNKGGASIPFGGIYTNFDSSASFDNNYYRNNFNAFQDMSTSYYEWNTNGNNVVFDSSDSITWDEATASVDSITNTKTVSYTMTINDSIPATDIWIDVADMSGNYLKRALPVTLEVAGPAALTFESGENQKVTSFFNEGVLLAIISAFDTTSDNTSELSSAMGIEDGALPSWTTQLASWAVEDKIEVADMVIAVEYVINQ